MSLKLKCYTTSISVDKTMGQIMGLLREAGARSIQFDNDAETLQPCAVRFAFAWTGQVPMEFCIRANIGGVYEFLQHQRGAPKGWDQAARVAWRVIREWIHSQLSLMAAGLAEPIDVFCGYLTDHQGRVLVDLLKEKPQLFLTAGVER
jgi:hypothetical protein